MFSVTIILLAIGAALFLLHTSFGQYVRNQTLLLFAVFAYGAAFSGMAIALAADWVVLTSISWGALGVSVMLLLLSMRTLERRPAKPKVEQPERTGPRPTHEELLRRDRE